jgi:hypothetical protein
MMMSTKNSGKRCLLGIAGLLLCVNSHAYSGGDGTEQNPYLISSKADMEQLASEVNDEQSHAGDYFLLTRDLTAADDTITFMIGAYTKTFSGIFDGGKHEIAVKINATTISVGLFSRIDGATIKNLGVSGSVTATISTYAYCGGICGRTESNTTISNCYNKADVYSESESASSFTGGIVGRVEGDKNVIINKCYNTGNISSKTSNYSSDVGGICGYINSNTKTTVSNCYNTGNIYSEADRSRSSSGGIAGESSDNAIINCYNTGNVSAVSSAHSSYIGGISGLGPGSSSGKVQNCFVANCQITDSKPDPDLMGRIGGRPGANPLFHPDNYINDYAESSSVTINGKTVSNQDENKKNGIDITLANLQNKAWLASNLSWDFNNVWKIKPGEFPTLRDEFDVTSILPVALMLNVSVYPNPVRQYLYIQCDYPVEKVEIYDQTATIVLRDTNYLEKMDVSALSNGMYILKIYAGTGMISKKIIVNK